MLARITNYGYRKIFPTCLGNMFIPRQKPFELDNPKAIKELSHFKDVVVEILEDDERIDYARYPIHQLRKIASQLGIKGSFYMKKIDLIKKLEEQNATV
jgi:transcription initiation factor TFIIIB Brf1 subunit/transcription initiation factor TFIIB